MQSISKPLRLLHALEHQGFTLSLEGARLRVAPSSSLSPEQRQAIKENRKDFITLLSNRQHTTHWAEALVLRHGRVSLIMDNYAVIGLNSSEELAFHREYSEALGEYAEVRAQGVVLETWGESPVTS